MATNYLHMHIFKLAFIELRTLQVLYTLWLVKHFNRNAHILGYNNPNLELLRIYAFWQSLLSKATEIAFRFELQECS